MAKLIRAGVRALVVDDDLPGRILAESVLALLGAQVAAVIDGEACIAAFRAQRFDVIFMDNRMPRMSGLEATVAIRRIEAQAGWARTPVIALTACAFPSERVEFLASGADDMLVKPYRIEALAAMLLKWGQH